MADELYLNLWFPTLAGTEMVPRLAQVLAQFPASAQAPGVGCLAVRPLSWNEPSLLEQHLDYKVPWNEALPALAEFAHPDYAFEVEMMWDLWQPVEEGAFDPTWRSAPSRVRFMLQGTDFEEGAWQEDGHIHIDLGLDTPFLHEEREFTPAVEERVKANIRKLVDFTQALEKSAGIVNRLLWSESEEDLAQRLIAKLQRVH